MKHEWSHEEYEEKEMERLSFKNCVRRHRLVDMSQKVERKIKKCTCGHREEIMKEFWRFAIEVLYAKRKKDGV